MVFLCKILNDKAGTTIPVAFEGPDQDRVKGGRLAIQGGFERVGKPNTCVSKERILFPAGKTHRGTLNQNRRLRGDSLNDHKNIP